MIPKWLSYLLIALIAMQSVGAMAGDDHQSHQDGNQHLEFEHEHDSKTANTDEESYSIPGVEFDCHHCCHCHNLANFGVLPKSNSMNMALLDRKIIEFHDKYRSNLYSPELRPPIV